MLRITAASFRPYGRLIGYPGKSAKGRKKNLWRIILTEEGKVGWRIAYLIVRDRGLKRLEMHPHTHESFEPVRGRSVLFVTAKPRDLRTIKAFQLDKPVIVKKGVWHGIVTLSPETEIKITENAYVKCVYCKLSSRLTPPRTKGR